MSSSLPCFVTLQRLMADANAYLGPAELHGMLCGFICHGDIVPEPKCMDLILNDADEHEYEQLIKQIKLLFSLSLQQLSDFGFEFELLLLDDDCEFVERLSTLSQWSEGFVLGLEFAQKTQRKTYAADVKEVIDDIREIASAYQRFQEEKDEVDEQVLLELEEHVRLGAVFVFSQLNTAQPPTRH
jgi:uncharacterized protein